MSLKWFGTINPWDGTGGTPGNWPDVNNIPISKRKATGHEFPWNCMRNDSCNPVHQHYVNIPNWDANFQKASDYCKNNGLSLMFQAWYPGFDGATSWDLMKSCFQGITKYLQGYPVYVIIANELLTGNASSPVDCNKNPFAQLGGRGSTGLDGWVNWIKELRKIFPSNCLLGLNEFNAQDESTSPGTWNLDPAIKAYQVARDHGAPLDFLGAEGYWLNTNYHSSANPSAMIDATCNKFSDATGGVPIFYSECTIDVANKGARFYSKQIDLWKAMLQKMSDNPHVIGFTGPWGGYRYKTIWAGSSGEDCKGLNWMYNDSSGNASRDPDGGSNVGPGAITQTLTWLQSWVPANVTGDSPAPPNPMPESPDNTEVLNDSTSKIVDANSATWTCSGGKAKKDGANAGYTNNVTRLYYKAHVVNQENDQGSWWKWTGSDWADTTDPTGGSSGGGALASGTYTVSAGTKIVVP